MAVERDLNELRIDRSSLPEEPKSRSWIWILTAVLVLAAAAFLFQRPKAVAVRTASVVESAGGSGGGPGTVLNASGYVTARRRATISAKITGRVSEVLIDEGMKVEEGQVLARLDDRQAKNELALAEAQASSARQSVEETTVRLEQARVDLKRAEELTSKGVSSQSTLDSARADANSLAARLKVAREQVSVADKNTAVLAQELAETVVRAPFAGVAISKDAQPGEIVSPMSAGGGFTRTGICTIVDMASLEIEVDVNEAYLERVKTGQKVTATLDAYPDWQIPAHVITVIPAADRQKATVKVRIGFDALDARLLPDMGAKVAFLAEASAATNAQQQARTVPRAAIRGDKGHEYVLVVKEGVLERRTVTLGPAQSDPAEVMGGLSPGEQVVIEGPADLANGAKVRVTGPQ
ncbi:MAG: efflux RND transporter periplasmic adaptor subunit [Acidobacteriota bacterium]